MRFERVSLIPPDSIHFAYCHRQHSLLFHRIRRLKSAWRGEPRTWHVDTARARHVTLAARDWTEHDGTTSAIGQLVWRFKLMGATTSQSISMSRLMHELSTSRTSPKSRPQVVLGNSCSALSDWHGGDIYFRDTVSLNPNSFCWSPSLFDKDLLPRHSRGL